MENGGPRTTARSVSEGIPTPNKPPVEYGRQNTIIPIVADGASVLGQRFLDTHH